MRTTTINQKIVALDCSLPDQEWFNTVGDLTALRGNEADGFYRSNYNRGPLLYSLVAAHRPTTVLEFGTGRGYGTVCMAKAMVDHKIDGQIFTVDLLAFNDLQSWPIDRGSGPVVETVSAEDVWSRHFDTAWLERITRLTGNSSAVIDEWHQSDRAKPEFCFVDAGHRYEEVRHDFYACLSICTVAPVILFDDYSPRQDFGVKRLIDSEVSRMCDTELLCTEWRDGDMAGTEDRELQGMALVEGGNDRNSALGWPPPETVQQRLRSSHRQLRVLYAKDRVKSFLRPIVNAWRS